MLISGYGVICSMFSNHYMKQLNSRLRYSLSCSHGQRTFRLAVSLSLSSFYLIIIILFFLRFILIMVVVLTLQMIMKCQAQEHVICVARGNLGEKHEPSGGA